MSEPSSRLPFHEETFRRAQTFANQLLAEIPELESIAIVPSWHPQQDRVEAAMIVGKHGPLLHAGELMRLALQMHAGLRAHLGKFMPLFESIDQRATELRTTIEQRQKELDELEQRLVEARLRAPANDQR
jgi:hypothetical protein